MPQIKAAIQPPVPSKFNQFQSAFEKGRCNGEMHCEMKPGGTDIIPEQDGTVWRNNRQLMKETVPQAFPPLAAGPQKVCV